LRSTDEQGTYKTAIKSKEPSKCRGTNWGAESWGLARALETRRGTIQTLHTHLKQKEGGQQSNQISLNQGGSGGGLGNPRNYQKIMQRNRETRGGGRRATKLEGGYSFPWGGGNLG